MLIVLRTELKVPLKLKHHVPIIGLNGPAGLAAVSTHLGRLPPRKPSLGIKRQAGPTEFAAHREAQLQDPAAIGVAR